MSRSLRRFSVNPSAETPRGVSSNSAADKNMDIPKLPRRKYTLGKEPNPIKSISYHTDCTTLHHALEDALDHREYEALKESKLGVFIKFQELRFGWASRLVQFMLGFQLDIKKKYELWCLVGPEPLRFSLIEFEKLTGLNCEYIEDLESSYCPVTPEMSAFWEKLGVNINAGPSTDQIITALKRCKERSRDDRKRLVYLAIFVGYIEEKKVLIESLKAKNITGFYTIDALRQGFGTCLAEIKHLLDRIGVVEKNLGITPTPPKQTQEPGSERESVNGAKEKSGKKRKERKEDPKEDPKKRMERKEDPKEDPKKRMERKEDPKEDQKGDPKEDASEVAKDDPKEDASEVGNEGASSSKVPSLVVAEEVEEPSVLLLEKENSTLSDKVKERARYESKRDAAHLELQRNAALAVQRGRSERKWILAPTQSSPYKGNITAKTIIPNSNKSVFTPFHPLDKAAQKLLIDHWKTCPQVNYSSIIACFKSSALIGFPLFVLQ
ncbi:uncharacterized protein LOC130500065 [Raphanus sativus]|uniref:Uncharacterized protein LOC130500065 n=1 Tax=Raphanus sativus TaxID=3726 RepID=A0A9W3CGW3_RAPSA|nr:uncharacterized protein LOC130500065 [Raphanus sativus]